jgi:hypothetical protein
MAQLFIVLLVPPVVGLVTYFIVRFSSKRDTLVIAGAPPRRKTAPRASVFARSAKRLQNLKPQLHSRGRVITLVALGIVSGFVFGWYLL